MKCSAATLAFIFFLLITTGASAQTPKSAPPGSGFVDVDGSRLYFEECGSGSSAVVRLHDGGANSAVWDDVWPSFCSRFHAIRYDRRGYGRSPATTKPYFEADDLAALLRDRKIEHAQIVASSHGGQVAMNFALRYASQASALVLVGPAASGFPYSEHFAMRERSLGLSDKLPDIIDAALRDPYLVLPGHEAAKKRLRALMESAPQDLTHSDMPLPERPVFPRVQQLRIPTLILSGSGDIADNLAVAGALVMAIPEATRVVVPDTGHLMYIEKPEEFFKLVSAFLIAHGS